MKDTPTNNPDTLLDTVVAALTTASTQPTPAATTNRAGDTNRATGTAATLDATEDDRSLLRALRDIGNQAAAALDRLDRAATEHDAEQHRRAKQAETEARRHRWASWTPPTHPGGTITVTGPDRLSDREADEETRSTSNFPTPGTGVRVGRFDLDKPVAVLDICDNAGTRIATIAIEEDGTVHTHRRFADKITDYTAPTPPRTELDALRATNPWTREDPAASTAGGESDIARAINHLLEHADTTGEWVRRAERARAAAADTQARLEAEYERTAREWRALSKHPDRIPAQALNTWMRNNSAIDYNASGGKIGGWTIAAVPIAGQTRPDILTRDPRRSARIKRTSAVGATQVLFAARLEYRDAHGWRRAPQHKFYDSNIASLTKAIPGLVVKMPEDRGALFIATDKPEHVAALDGALAEWILLGENT